LKCGEQVATAQAQDAAKVPEACQEQMDRMQLKQLIQSLAVNLDFAQAELDAQTVVVE
jgi:hypothetical protein|tara:strand:+ start:257 stop:430 length:174 start_codon:yes stop_codon:yes gene_type:complete